MDDLFQVLADARRREILKQLAGGERSAGEVHGKQADVTFGAVSQHLKVLERAGLVSSRKAGRNRFYQANIEALLPLRQWLDWMWDRSLERLKQLAEAESKLAGGGLSVERHLKASSSSTIRPQSPIRRISTPRKKVEKRDVGRRRK